jgi:hypothetical protein
MSGELLVQPFLSSATCTLKSALFLKPEVVNVSGWKHPEHAGTPWWQHSNRAKFFQAQYINISTPKPLSVKVIRVMIRFSAMAIKTVVVMGG